jgi:hypothetical protein
LIVQENNSLAARYEVIREVKPHSLDADVRAATCQYLLRYRELSRKIN